MRTPKMTTCKKCHRSYSTMSEVNHGKTKSARIQKRNVFSTDKNEM